MLLWRRRAKHRIFRHAATGRDRLTNATLPGVAVCIPTFNQAAFVERAVRSALTQNGFPAVEVWVSDDASTDDTPAVMTALCAREPRVRYHRHEQNLGIAANATWVLSQPATEFVVRLDSDDVLLPDYVATLVNRLAAYPEAAYAHTAVERIDANDAVFAVSRLFRPREYVGASDALREAVKGYKTVANILMFRAEALRKAGYYRGCPNFAEDYDLAVRLADHGYGNVYVDQVLARYRVWTDAGGVRARRKAEHVRGLIHVFHESLAAAWRRRGWNPAELHAARRRMATHMAASLFVPWFSAAERAELLDLLYQLDSSAGVRMRVFLLRLGLAPLFAWAARVDTAARRAIKNLLARLKPQPAPTPR